MKSSSKIQKGFTLMELLVVMAIIALLSAVVLSATNAARSKARDAKRLEDIHSVQVALESYYQRNNSYPTTFAGAMPAYWGSCAAYNAGGAHGGTSGATGWVPNLAPTDMPILPLDPLPFNPDGCYVYASNGADYKIMALHTMEFPDSNSQNYDHARSSTYDFNTPGASAW